MLQRVEFSRPLSGAAPGRGGAGVGDEVGAIRRPAGLGRAGARRPIPGRARAGVRPFA